MYYPDYSQFFLEKLEALRGEKIAILSHMRPDGDCVGAQVALFRALDQLGYDVIAVNVHAIPRNLQSLVQATPIALAEYSELEGRVAITVDCADSGRPGTYLTKAFPEIYLNIDHHVSNDNYAQHNIVISESAATSEILAGLFLDNDLNIDPLTAQALYVGIATDTGQFLYPSTSSQTFEIAGKLVSLGASPSLAGEELYQREPFGRIRLLQHFLSTLRMECEDKVCLGMLKSSDYEQNGLNRDASEGFVDYPRSIDGVKIGIFIEFNESDLKIKGSLRAKDPRYELNKLAAIFNGGGHACASGFTVQGKSWDHFYPELITQVSAHLLKQEN